MKNLTGIRNSQIDITKGLLCIIMVFSHYSRLQCNDIMTHTVSAVAHWMTFPTFAFCFGYACQKAYIDKMPNHTSKALYTSYKCFASYFVITVFALMTDPAFSKEMLTNYAFFESSHPYASFIMPYGIFALIVAFFPKFLIWSSGSAKRIFFVLMISISLTFLHLIVNWDDYNPAAIIGFIIGDSGQAQGYFYPITHFLPVYLMGMYFSKNNILNPDKKLVAAAVIFFVLFYSIRLYDYMSPAEARFNLITRKPTSFLVVLQSMASPIILYVVSGYVLKCLPDFVCKFLNYMGYNLLYFLVISTMIFFFMTNIPAMTNLNGVYAILGFVLEFYAMYFISTIAVPKNKTNKSISEFKSSVK